MGVWAADALVIDFLILHLADDLTDDVTVEDLALTAGVLKAGVLVEVLVDVTTDVLVTAGVLEDRRGCLLSVPGLTLALLVTPLLTLATGL